jgi:zinc protease
MLVSRVAMLAALLSTSLFAQAPAKAPAPPPVKTAAALPAARSLVDRHVAAIGGRAAILAHKSMRATGTLSMSASGISGPIEVYGSAPDRVLVKASISGIGEIVEGFDGVHAWSINPMTGPALKTGKELEQTKLDADFYSELRDPKKYTLTTVGKETFDGRECYKVSVKRIDGSEDFDFYDAATGLRAGSINTRETQMGTMTVSNTEGGYKKFGPITQATVLTQKVMGVEQKITLETVEYNTVNAAVFELPPAIKALVK